MRPLLIALLVAAPVFADGLDDLLRNLNVEARADRNGFSARVSTQFNVGDVQVRAVLGQVSDPADAFMVFQLGQLTRQPVDRVLAVYKTHKGHGWGRMAQELGIKPGSAQFHALKRGEYRLTGSASGGHGEGGDEGHGKGKGKGHGKGHGKGRG